MLKKDLAGGAPLKHIEVTFRLIKGDREDEDQ
jgi:hypothetical protein